MRARKRFAASFLGFAIAMTAATAAGAATPITPAPNLRTVPGGPVSSLPATSHAEIAVNGDHDVDVAQGGSGGVVNVRRVARNGVVVGSTQFTPDPASSLAEVTQIAPVPGSTEVWVAIGTGRPAGGASIGYDAWLARISGSGNSVQQLIHLPVDNLPGTNGAGMFPTGLVFTEGRLVVLGTAFGVVNGTTLTGASLISLDPATGAVQWARDVSADSKDLSYSKLGAVGRDVVFTHTTSTGVVLTHYDALSGYTNPYYDLTLGPITENARGIATIGSNVIVQHGPFLETLTDMSGGWVRVASCDIGEPLFFSSIAAGPEGVIVPVAPTTVGGVDGSCHETWTGTAKITGTSNPSDVAYDPYTGTVFFAGSGFVTSFQAYTAPSAPLAVNAVPGDGKATISWTPPASTGNTALLYYDVTVGTAHYNIQPDQTSFTAWGLTNGTTYVVNVVAVNGVGASLPGTTAVTPVAPPLTLSIDDAVTVEGVHASDWVHLNHAATTTVTVQWAMRNGTAGRRDFKLTTGTLTFAPGQTAAAIDLFAKKDRHTEGDETYSVVLSSPTGGAQLGRSTATITITHNNT